MPKTNTKKLKEEEMPKEEAVAPTPPPASKREVDQQWFFTKDEMIYLAPRQLLLQDYSNIVNRLDMDIKQFILSQVCKRIGIDPKGLDLHFDIEKGSMYTIKPLLYGADGKPAMVTPKEPDATEETPS